jgi:hypothetical protein
MSQARELLDDLAVIGASVEPAGMQLILRAGPTAVPAALVRRVREAKSDLIAMLSSASKTESPAHDNDAAVINHIRKDRSQEVRIIRWLDQHPAPSPPGVCVWCRRPESPNEVVVPFGALPGTHTWLHAECWPGWHQARRTEALRALEAAQEPG